MHQTAAGVHGWWDGKLQTSITPEQAKLLKGKKPPPPTVKVLTENTIGRAAERAQNLDPPRELYVEMDCPQAYEATQEARRRREDEL